MQYEFGSGSLYGVRTDVGANPTPIPFAALQEVSVDLSFNIKELHGQYQFPLTVARGLGKISGKAKNGRFLAAAFNDIFFNGSSATGETRTAVNEGAAGGTAIPGTPYQITVTNSATWVLDLGVINATTGVPLTRVAAAPATGQYSVAAGVYTFAAADTGTKVYISYTYTVSASGKTITISNQLLGNQTVFKVVLNQQYSDGTGTKHLTLTLNQCISGKLTFATKLEDFNVPEFDFSAFADTAGVVGTLSLGE